MHADTDVVEGNDEISLYFTCLNKFKKFKVDLKFFGWVWSKMGVATLVTGH